MNIIYSIARSQWQKRNRYIAEIKSLCTDDKNARILVVQKFQPKISNAVLNS